MVLAATIPFSHIIHCSLLIGDNMRNLFICLLMVFALMQDASALTVYPNQNSGTNVTTNSEFCPLLPMIELFCKDGYHVEIQHDAKGCEVGQMCVTNKPACPGGTGCNNTITKPKCGCFEECADTCYVVCYTCPPPQVCTKEAIVCSDGSVVSRNPDNNCEFDQCPNDLDDLKRQLKESNSLLRELIALIKSLFPF
ncbi:Uncharacterised protein [Candidatus Bilamarchaeum dharawalense]|uniref:Uncharacterized protein n=1 Tax=Candidatus Bilamarchaeum dharawalense TaxID=2885759 RepID=A0A5E4LMV4_9ARCH|nr:Uncharacterised protein [Candidatus Bilamarchaeum dharawalense]